MSDLSSTINTKPSDDKEIVPKWAYGVIAGGSATLVTAGAVAYHIISKKHREKAAIADAKLLDNDQITPRLPPVSRYSPRPGEQVI